MWYGQEVPHRCPLMGQKVPSECPNPELLLRACQDVLPSGNSQGQLLSRPPSSLQETSSILVQLVLKMFPVQVFADVMEQVAGPIRVRRFVSGTGYSHA